MSITDLADAFRSQVDESGAIKVDVETLRSSGATNVLQLTEDLKVYLDLSAPLTISGLNKGDVVMNAGLLEIQAGEAKFLNISLNVITLRFEMQSDLLVMILAAGDFPGDWAFNHSFPSLNVLPELSRKLSDRMFIFASDSINSWPISPGVQEQLEVGLNFFANLSLESSETPFYMLRSFLEFAAFAYATNAYLFGQIDLKNRIAASSLEYPTVNLKTPVLDSEETILTLFRFLKIKRPLLGVRVVQFEERDEGEIHHGAFPEVYIQVEIDLNGVDIPFAAGLGYDNFFIFNVPVPPELSPAQLFRLMGGNNWLSNIPAPLLQALQAIRFRNFTITAFINPTNSEGPGFQLASMAAHVGSGAKVTSFGPFSDFDFEVVWTILRPTEPAEAHSLLGVQGSIDMENIGTFTIEVEGV